MENFREIAEAFLAEDALVQVRDGRRAGRRRGAAVSPTPPCAMPWGRGASGSSPATGGPRPHGGCPGRAARMKPRAWLGPWERPSGAAARCARGCMAGESCGGTPLGGPVTASATCRGRARQTPLAARIAALLRDSGQRVAILSRGYGGTSSGAPLLVSDGDAVLAAADVAGDEPVMLARSLQGVIVAVATRRVEAGRLVEARFGPCVHVLDDGFQHLGLARDLDLVAIEPEDLAGRPMPAGVLRERPSALARADLVLLSARNGAPLPPGLDAARTLRWHRRSLGFFTPEGLARPMPSRALWSPPSRPPSA